MIRSIKNFFKKIAPTVQVVRARFDAASHGGENEKHWAAADYLSADAEANESVRRTLRNRCRYEVANNTYAKGMILTLANDTIGTGPRLQLLTEDRDINAKVEREFAVWACSIDLPGKLRTVRMARCQDGEAFILMVQNPKLDPMKPQLDLQLIEADRVTDLSGGTSGDSIDGIRYDSYGNPESYRILKYHPGGDEFDKDFYAAEDVDAEHVIHYFRSDRPGTHRGVPEITSALPLFAQLRRFTLAVISAAESAADFAGIIYTDAPADETADVQPMDTVSLRRNMLVTMPAGWRMSQIDAKQPCSTYSEFKKEILNEISRCLNMPYNIAAGNSSGYNYASGRLDHQTYYKSISVERYNIELNILNRIFRMWLREYSLLNGVEFAPGFRHQWMWDGFEHVDPAKEANAVKIRLENRTTTYAAEFAKQGRDWEYEMQQIAKEQKMMAELGILPGAVDVNRGSQSIEEQENE